MGTNANFLVRAGSSSTPPLTYQWLFNDSEISGATNSTFSIAHITPDDEGSYSARISNNEGDAYSGYAQLTVVVPPSIVTQPDAAPDPIYDGDSYVFSVEATGTDPLTYQWRLNGANITGETDASIVATKAGVYTVKVSNSINGIGGSTVSSNANLVVWFVPQVTTQPTSRTVLAGKSTTFSTVATGTKPLTYQWMFNDVEIEGATTNSYTVANANSTDAGNYSVHVQNIAGEAFSDYAELAVQIPPAITMQPVSQIVNEGDDVIFNVAIREDATWPIDYQWRFKGINIDDGGNGEFLYLPNVTPDQAGTYSVVISNEAGIVTSTNVNLVVRSAPDIVTSPKDARVGFGTNFTFSVKATGTGPLAYQWLFNEKQISGATNSIYSFKPNTTNQTGLYAVFVSNVVDVVTSTPAVLTVIGETVLPTVTITNPLAAFTTVTSPSLNFAGKASDNAGLSKVLCQLNSNAFVTATGTAVWSMPYTLTVGTNILRAKSVDVSGNTSVVGSRTVFYSVKSPLTLVTNGLGTISGVTSSMLEVGRGYTATAKPGIGQIFAGWTGSITNGNATLTFLMRSNMVLQANFIPDPYIPRKGVYAGLFFETNGVRQISSGAFTFTLAEKGLLNGKVLMGGLSYIFTNRFDATGNAVAQVTRKGLTPLSLSLHIDVTTMADEVTGTVSNATWSATLQGDRNVFSKTNPNPRMGAYTLVIPGSNTPGIPAGDGYGVAMVDALGNVKLTGALADGTAISQATTVSKTGDWPLYVPVYTGKGSILSWVTLVNTNDVAGDLTWIHPTITAKYYPAGFTNLTSVTGGIYKKPAKGQRALNFTNGIALLSGGNLLTPITNSVLLTSNNTFVIASTINLKLLLATNGTLSGSFIHPKTKLATPIKGVIVRQENEGHGYFLGTNQSGLFRLQSN